MTDAEWARAPPVPQVSIIRRTLKLSQERFATTFHIPIGTIWDWEQGRYEPDAAARAYLRVIAREPNTVPGRFAARTKPSLRPPHTNAIGLTRSEGQRLGKKPAGARRSTAAGANAPQSAGRSAPVRALSRQERELMIAANNGHLLAFDNPSGLPAWLSDALCLPAALHR